MMPRVSIIILNWNGWRDTIECLESLYRITYPNYDVIVVDNGSKDDSVEKIKEYAEGKSEVNSKFFEYNPSNKPIKVFEISEDEARQGKFNRPLYEKFGVDRRMILIKNKDNYGFAGGNNIGIKFALSVLNPKYILLLNNDTVVDNKVLNELVKVAESDEKVGVVGSTLLYYEDINKIQSAGELIIKPWLNIIQRLKNQNIKNIYTTNPLPVDYVSGAALMLKSKILHEVGLFDPSFYLYWEETELQARITRKGFRIMCVPTSFVWHKLFKSSRSSAHRTYFFSRNKILYAQKHLSKKEYIIFLIKRVLFDFWFYTGGYFIKHLLVYGDVSNAFSYFKGTLDGVFKRPPRI
ncbi:MAG: glycosyltransferase family 2 protein [Candidatus Marinimicrobia bacterium]|nr:glycosyltransferase family 2 protein [Candidatus Neomarinimicrobiota bacterium]